jgi:hypothetical protein
MFIQPPNRDRYGRLTGALKGLVSVAYRKQKGAFGRAYDEAA